MCAQLLAAAEQAGEISPGTSAHELMLGIGGLCIGKDVDPGFEPRRLVELLIRGLQQGSHPPPR